jgi:hypothetical protein
MELATAHSMTPVPYVVDRFESQIDAFVAAGVVTWARRQEHRKPVLLESGCVQDPSPGAGLGSGNFGEV